MKKYAQRKIFVIFLDFLISHFKHITNQYLVNFGNFTSFSHKISLIKCLIDRSFKICNNWNSLHNNIEDSKYNLVKNAYPPFLIEEVIKKYLDHKFSSNKNQLKDRSDIYYFKLR